VEPPKYSGRKKEPFFMFKRDMIQYCEAHEIDYEEWPTAVRLFLTGHAKNWVESKDPQEE